MKHIKENKELNSSRPTAGFLLSKIEKKAQKGYSGRVIRETKSPTETVNLAKELLEHVVSFNSSGAVVVALEGELGAGKTTFVQGCANILGIHETVTSPTFVIMKHYVINNHQRFKTMIHIDAYRLHDAKELEKLNIKDFLDDWGAIVFIEWSERVSEALPKEHIAIHIDHIDEEVRKFSINYF